MKILKKRTAGRADDGTGSLGQRQTQPGFITSIDELYLMKWKVESTPANVAEDKSGVEKRKYPCAVHTYTSRAYELPGVAAPNTRPERVNPDTPLTVIG